MERTRLPIPPENKGEIEYSSEIIRNTITYTRAKAFCNQYIGDQDARACVRLWRPNYGVVAMLFERYWLGGHSPGYTDVACVTIPVAWELVKKRLATDLYGTVREYVVKEGAVPKPSQSCFKLPR